MQIIYMLALVLLCVQALPTTKTVFRNHDQLLPKTVKRGESLGQKVGVSSHTCATDRQQSADFEREKKHRNLK